MAKKLLIYEFVRSSALDDVIMEDYDWTSDREANKLSSRADSIQLNREIAAQGAETAKHAEQGAIVKTALIDFITKQLPNVRMQRSRQTLADMALKDVKLGQDFKDIVSKQELKPWFHMLCAGVQGFLQGQNRAQVMSLLKPYHGKITELVKSVSPEITQILKQHIQQKAANPWK